MSYKTLVLNEEQAEFLEETMTDYLETNQELPFGINHNLAQEVLDKLQEL